MVTGVLLAASFACAPVEAEETKIGYVSLSKIFDGYERTKASDAQLEKKGKQRETELQGRVGELKKLRESVELLSDQAREAKTREIEQKADDLQRFRTNAARDLRRERDKVAKEILQDIRRVVDEYAKANGFAMVLKAEDVLLYAQSRQDLTDEILKALNARYAAASSAR